jgi:hypothetical protein
MPQRLICLYLVLTVLLLLPLPTNAQESIGSVTEQFGNAVLEREEVNYDLETTSSIQFLDNVKTGTGSVGINFLDDTNVAISPQSSLLIDDFVYDPNNAEASTLGLRVALGTVRYASGNIANLNRQNVNIRTPTARIGVRGTAFSMTVNEVGKSLIILLPNADGTVGEIEVITAGGTQILTTAFESVVTTYVEAPPSQSVILDLTLDQISNLLIVSPPKEYIDAYLEEQAADGITNLLDVDFLQFTGLEENELEKDELAFNELDINELDVELLENVLDKLVQVLAASELEDGRVSGLNPRTQVVTVIQDQDILLSRRINNDIVLNLNGDYGYTVNLEQGGVRIPEITTADENLTNEISIIQNN